MPARCNQEHGGKPMGSDRVWDNDAEDAFRTATRALIRTNLMDSLYRKEVARTNRIGVGMTGIHEYAWARFGFGWKDLVDEEKSLDVLADALALQARCAGRGVKATR
jgi:hypothetical protein